MRRRALLPALGISLTMVALGVTADNRHRTFRAFAELVPANEVPSVSSGARGRFKATIDRENQTISYEVSYEGLEDAPTQSHIHFGQRHTLGGVSVFLCGNAPAVPPAPFPAPPACPVSPATVTGVLTAANIVGPNGQGIAPSLNGVNEFDELVEAILSGNTYANVHSAKFQGGEVRGQIRTDERHGKH
ncbi:MAG TPA: CHRD domain-containing protein [Steroidobacteraceae bacterium]|jgi:CHRD domain-containing protein|nr:CHRD domain-containing protein [Steroidobacteraceae bacterium]